MSTAAMTGMMCVIWPVSSNRMTVVEIVCVTAPENAAAATTLERKTKIRDENDFKSVRLRLEKDFAEIKSFERSLLRIRQE